MKTLSEFKNNGEAALEALLQQSVYGCVEQAIASLSLFTHPETVTQTENKALFRIRRYRESEKRGNVLHAERVVLCDNLSPACLFLWANDLVKSDLVEVQYNHVYQKSYDPDFYTSLANVCVTPAFLSKLTDKNARIIQLLRYRVKELYGFLPDGEPQPVKPDIYDRLIWAPPLPSCGQLKERISQRLERNAKSRIAASIEHFGWHFAPQPIP